VKLSASENTTHIKIGDCEGDLIMTDVECFKEVLEKGVGELGAMVEEF